MLLNHRWLQYLYELEFLFRAAWIQHYISVCNLVIVGIHYLLYTRRRANHKPFGFPLDLYSWNYVVIEMPCWFMHKLTHSLCMVRQHTLQCRIDMCYILMLSQHFLHPMLPFNSRSYSNWEMLQSSSYSSVPPPCSPGHHHCRSVQLYRKTECCHASR